MAKVRKRVGKNGKVSYQIDYFEPVPTEKQFEDETEAYRVFDEARRDNKRATSNV